MTDSNNTNISLDTPKITVVKSPRAKRLATKSPTLGYTSDKNKTVPLAGLNLIANPKKQRDSDTESVKHEEAPTFDLSGNDADVVDDNFEEDEDDGVDPLQGQALSGTDDYEEDVLEEDENEEKVPLTYEEILEAKQDFLYKLDRLEKQGYRVSRKYTLASNLDDIRCEYNKLKRQRDVEKSIKFYRKALMGLVSGAEYLNNKFDPLDLKLDGWSESQMENISDYDEVFEELHDKYSESISMAPELKLMFMVGGSAFMFHLTNTLFRKQAPGLDEVLKRNPELMRSLSQATLNTMNDNMGGQNNPMFNMMSQGINVASDARSSRAPPNLQPRPEPGGARTMRGPQGVDEILQNISKGGEGQPGKRRRRRRKAGAINLEF